MANTNPDTPTPPGTAKRPGAVLMVCPECDDHFLGDTDGPEPCQCGGTYEPAPEYGDDSPNNENGPVTVPTCTHGNPLEATVCAPEGQHWENALCGCDLIEGRKRASGTKEGPVMDEYVELTLVCEGALERIEEVAPEDETAILDRLRKEYATQPGGAVEVYRLHHPHPQELGEDEECACAQFETDHHPAEVWPEVLPPLFDTGDRFNSMVAAGEVCRRLERKTGTAPQIWTPDDGSGDWGISLP